MENGANLPGYVPLYLHLTASACGPFLTICTKKRTAYSEEHSAKLFFLVRFDIAAGNAESMNARPVKRERALLPFVSF